ncbi:LLM class flavin-dependent oxidoreductase [Paenibacillus eucommiae]|uniref:FMN-dependent oxidoreductase (Nitrilotriacetate monooxygenase family) n=1 Tax=Paenibacillus eucommiae TaxID=1355755 RepID=A0ABS4J931_9BACL|nr:LLM class flavin-dependent oxidoreductase [Paenibacillus eucommiae]MBP1996351.1 FMN-dependent oxidoreductase (nitrilotriacetate monooxygenase family) [Paenibacillus eucommiae]
MGKRIYLNVITIAGPTASPGMWAHPEDRGQEYTDLNYWIELAKTLERGKFDAIFFADMLGVYDTYQGSMDTAIRQTIQVPLNDPSYLIPAMAAVTKHLGFAATFSTTYEHPYALSRKMSTLDHLTKGRIGWNIVTSNIDSAAKNYGMEQQMGLIDRYDRGDEYMDVVYKLWEASWEHDAVVQDTAKRMYTDPSKVHDIGHKGAYFQVPGIHLTEPSPQRTPLLFQAGNSTRGREFAAKHAESIFLNTPTAAATKFIVNDIRERAEKQGRDPSKIFFFPKLTPIVGRTVQEAQSRYEDFLKYSSPEGIFALLGAWSGIDFSQYGPDKLLEFVEKRDNHGIIESFRRSDPNKKWSSEQLANFFAFGTSSLTIGSPGQIADVMESFVAETGVDGFNIGHIIQPGTLNEFVELVIPELQSRGLVQTEYREGTYREKIFGEGPYLSKDHPGRILAEAEAANRNRNKEVGSL